MKNDFSKYTDDELIKELELREKSKMPKIVENPNFGSLIYILTTYIDYIQKNKCTNDNYEHDIYESVLLTFFGNNIFDWINSNAK